jgi:protein phosphatase PTC7
VSSHEVRHGDIIVFGTDGVWDNLSAQDLLGYISPFMRSVGAWTMSERGVAVGESLASLTKDMNHIMPVGDHSLQSLLATLVVGRAKTASLNTRRDGPFAREMKRHYPYEDWRGGKVDDICVVVAVVVEHALS